MGLTRPAFQGHSKLIGIDTDRSGTYDLMSAIHSNYMNLSHIVSEINGEIGRTL